MSRCGICSQPGHNSRTCPGPGQPAAKRSATVLRVVEDPAPAREEPALDPRIVEVAGLREQIDALRFETEEYERVRAELDRRIIANRVRLEQLLPQLAELREAAP